MLLANSNIATVVLVDKTTSPGPHGTVALPLQLLGNAAGSMDGLLRKLPRISAPAFCTPARGCSPQPAHTLGSIIIHFSARIHKWITLCISCGQTVKELWITHQM